MKVSVLSVIHIIVWREPTLVAHSCCYVRYHRRIRPCCISAHSWRAFVVSTFRSQEFELTFSCAVNPSLDYSLYAGFVHLAAGLSCGFTGLAAGYAIGIVGDSVGAVLLSLTTTLTFLSLVRSCLCIWIQSVRVNGAYPNFRRSVRTVWVSCLSAPISMQLTRLF